MKLHAFTTTIAVSGLFVCGAAAQQDQANRMTESTADKTFVMKAAQGGMAEVDLGNLAKDKATNDKVKHFGQQMVDDHSKANDELKSIATSKGISVPASLDSKDQSTKEHLAGLSGAEFDKAYMKDMVSDHEKDVAEFRKEADHGSDSDIKAFAAKTLPTLQHHLQMAKDTLADTKNEH